MLNYDSRAFRSQKKKNKKVLTFVVSLYLKRLLIFKKKALASCFPSAQKT